MVEIFDSLSIKIRAASYAWAICTALGVILAALGVKSQYAALIILTATALSLITIAWRLDKPRLEGSITSLRIECRELQDSISHNKRVLQLVYDQLAENVDVLERHLPELKLKRARSDHSSAVLAVDNIAIVLAHWSDGLRRLAQAGRREVAVQQARGLPSEAVYERQLSEITTLLEKWNSDYEILRLFIQIDSEILEQSHGADSDRKNLA